MKGIRFYLSLFFLITLSFQGYSQKATISISSDTILIGDYVNVKMKFSHKKGSELILDNLQKIGEGIEYVKTEEEEKTEKGDIVNVKLNIIYTSFDSGRHVIPPFPIVTRTDDTFDTLYIGDSVILKVGNPVLPENFEGYDIKGVKTYGNPLWKILAIVAACLLVITGIVWYLRRKFKKEKVELPFYKAVEIPHSLALKELKSIKQQGLLEKGDIKEYYTQITDVIRKYIERSTGTATMEKTSLEILNTLPKEFNKDTLRIYLKKIFTIADLVKFAKYIPLEADNEISWKTAYQFIDESKPKQEEIENEQKQENANTDNKQ